MKKKLNILFISFLIIFFWAIFSYYTSTNNLKEKKFNRINIDQIINKKITSLPILKNDTNNVIEYNNSLNQENTKDNPRSFWNLLNFK